MRKLLAACSLSFVLAATALCGPALAEPSSADIPIRRALEALGVQLGSKGEVRIEWTQAPPQCPGGYGPPPSTPNQNCRPHANTNQFPNCFKCK